MSACQDSNTEGSVSHGRSTQIKNIVHQFWKDWKYWTPITMPVMIRLYVCSIFFMFLFIYFQFLHTLQICAKLKPFVLYIYIFCQFVLNDTWFLFIFEMDFRIHTFYTNISFISSGLYQKLQTYEFYFNCF